jgi:hypothetical protein
MSSLSFPLLALLFFLPLTACAAGTPAATNAASKGIGIAFAGNVEKWIADCVPGYLSDQFGAAVRVRDFTDAPSTGDWQKVEQAAAARRGVDDVCLLVLMGGGKAGERTLSVNVGTGVGVVSIEALRPAGGLDADRKEQFRRRVEKEAMRAVALLAGMADCPFPPCALLAHKSEAELDLKARNLCPPCAFRARAKLRALGVTFKD